MTWLICSSICAGAVSVVGLHPSLQADRITSAAYSSSICEMEVGWQPYFMMKWKGCKLLARVRSVHYLEHRSSCKEVTATSSTAGRRTLWRLQLNWGCMWGRNSHRHNLSCKEEGAIEQDGMIKIVIDLHLHILFHMICPPFSFSLLHYKNPSIYHPCQ